METILERDLVLAGRKKAIENLRVAQLESGKYSVIAKLNWRTDEVVLVTQRKQVRGWVNLTRLLEHIKDDYGITSQINVTLKGEGA